MSKNKLSPQHVINQEALKQFFHGEGIQKKVREIVGKNANVFVTSLLQITNANPELAEADRMSIFNGALMAATLNLPLQDSLGFAYLIPYKRNYKGSDDIWYEKVEAQFQLGYKGFIQLAQRSGQFKRLASIPVYKEQLIKKDPINGFEFNWDYEPDENEAPVGYYAYFKLLNDFTAEIYMSRNDIIKHAIKYNPIFKRMKDISINNFNVKAWGAWKDNFEGMALKTVLKLLLSKQAPLSVEMQKAINSDQAVVKDVVNEEFDYIDTHAQEVVKLDDELVNQLDSLLTQTNSDKAGFMAYHGVNSLADLTKEQAEIAISQLTEELNKTINADVQEVYENNVPPPYEEEINY